jgi:hypothetical protein
MRLCWHAGLLQELVVVCEELAGECKLFVTPVQAVIGPGEHPNRRLEQSGTKTKAGTGTTAVGHAAPTRSGGAAVGETDLQDQLSTDALLHAARPINGRCQR